MHKPNNSINQFLTPSDPETLIYIGPSMNPTLKNYDIIRFSQPEDTDIRVGDIVVIRFPDNPSKKVIHRVISIHKDRIRTQGDNCRSPDPWITIDNILGRVTQVSRRDIEFPLNRDLSQYMAVVYFRTKNWILLAVLQLFKYPYELAASPQILSKYTTKYFLKSVRQYQTRSHRELRICLGKIVIARYCEEMPRWQIRAPFKILIDETRLPSFNNYT